MIVKTMFATPPSGRYRTTVGAEYDGYARTMKQIAFGRGRQMPLARSIDRMIGISRGLGLVNIRERRGVDITFFLCMNSDPQRETE